MQFKDVQLNIHGKVLWRKICVNKQQCKRHKDCSCNILHVRVRCMMRGCSKCMMRGCSMCGFTGGSLLGGGHISLLGLPHISSHRQKILNIIKHCFFYKRQKIGWFWFSQFISDKVYHQAWFLSALSGFFFIKSQMWTTENYLRIL